MQKEKNNKALTLTWHFNNNSKLFSGFVLDVEITKATVFHTGRVCHVWCNFESGYTCSITIIFGTPKNGSLKITSLPSNNYFSYRTVLQNGVNTLSKMGLKELGLFFHKLKFCAFRTIRFASNFASMYTYQIMYGETLDLQC